MKYKRFGNTGLLVSEVALGSMTFGGRGAYGAIGQLQQKEANELVKMALDSGINIIDTANVYGAGMSETIVGQALKDLEVDRESVVVATKVFGPMGKGPNYSGLSKKHILAQVEKSLDRLQLDYIDIYQIHNEDPVTPIEETLDALDDLVRGGLVRYIGVSNNHAWRIMKALGISSARGLARFESVQAYYTVVGRDLEREIIPLINEEKMGLLVWSPLAGGFLSGKFRRGAEKPEGARRSQFDFPPIDRELAFRAVDLMEAIGKERDATVAQVALAWLLAKPPVTSVILGARRPEQLKADIDATQVKLTADDISRLDAVAPPKPEYPSWINRSEDKDRRAYLAGKEPASPW
ncbi:MAG: aldo/keto reductase [Methanomassiliicoccales archaeon]|nr:aldo/keto reductase [Methanomassiliicoccales archaeon]